MVAPDSTSTTLPFDSLDEKEIKQEDQIKWIDDIYFLRSGVDVKNDSIENSLSSNATTKNNDENVQSSEGSKRFPMGSPLDVNVNSYEESERRCDVLFKMSEAYRNLWQHEDQLCDERTSRFWLINAGLFGAIWFIFSSTDFSNSLRPFAIPIQNFFAACEFNESLDGFLFLKLLLISLICILGICNSGVFLTQQMLGEKAFALLYQRYKGFLVGVFLNSSTSHSKVISKYEVISKYIKSHNLSGIFLTPPVFGIHADQDFKGRQPIRTCFTDGSWSMLNEKDGFLGEESLTSPFLIRGLAFYKIWMCLVSFSITSLIIMSCPLKSWDDLTRFCHHSPNYSLYANPWIVSLDVCLIICFFSRLIYFLNNRPAKFGKQECASLGIFVTSMFFFFLLNCFYFQQLLTEFFTIVSVCLLACYFNCFSKCLSDADKYLSDDSDDDKKEHRKFSIGYKCLFLIRLICLGYKDYWFKNIITLLLILCGLAWGICKLFSIESLKLILRLGIIYLYTYTLLSGVIFTELFRRPLYFSPIRLFYFNENLFWEFVKEKKQELDEKQSNRPHETTPI